MEISSDSNARLLIGASGNLGKEILNIDSNFLIPSSKELNISEYRMAMSYMTRHRDLDLIINCAAFTNTVAAESNPGDCFVVNTSGPLNVLRLRPKGCRFVHISTDYVFDGEDGPYSVDDKVNPISNYARSKAAAEMIVQSFPNTLIIRTSFFPREFPHSAAFDDQWTSKDFVDKIAPLVLKEALSEKVGIVHVGMKRRTVHDVASQRNRDLKKIKRKDVSSKILIPKDTSLII